MLVIGFAAMSLISIALLMCSALAVVSVNKTLPGNQRPPYMKILVCLLLLQFVIPQLFNFSGLYFNASLWRGVGHGVLGLGGLSLAFALWRTKRAAVPLSAVLFLCDAAYMVAVGVIRPSRFPHTIAEIIMLAPLIALGLIWHYCFKLRKLGLLH